MEILGVSGSLLRGNQQIGIEEVTTTRLGPSKVAHDLGSSAGTFASSVVNLMESVQSDAYFSAESPRGLIDNEPLPLLCTVRHRDTASGVRVGIGFSLGPETAVGYRLADFCAAVDKVKFCSLWAIEITPEQWPSQGCIVSSIFDRGPGASRRAEGAFDDPSGIVRQMTPSGKPRAKAAIETSNPKTSKNKERPSHLVSGLTVFEMVRKEIFRLLAENDGANMVKNVPVSMLNDLPTPSPNALWMEFDRRGRNDAVVIPFDDAVRRYLPRVRAVIKDDGLYVEEQRYDSKALRTTRFFELSSRRQQIEVDVFHLDICLRYVWLEVDSKMYELEIQLPLQAGSKKKYLSLSELQRASKLVKKASARMRLQSAAVALARNQAVEMNTGQPWDSSKRKSGRAKRGTRNAVRETAESKRQATGQRR